VFVFEPGPAAPETHFTFKQLQVLSIMKFQAIQLRSYLEGIHTGEAEKSQDRYKHYAKIENIEVQII